jgi:hypothetical protein
MRQNAGRILAFAGFKRLLDAIKKFMLGPADTYSRATTVS